MSDTWSTVSTNVTLIMSVSQIVLVKNQSVGFSRPYKIKMDIFKMSIFKKLVIFKKSGYCKKVDILKKWIFQKSGYFKNGFPHFRYILECLISIS